MEPTQSREEFDTALRRIRHEIKGRLVSHGLFGTVSYTDVGPTDHAPTGSKIEIVVKGKTAEMSFDRRDIEGCRLRVVGPVLAGIVSMIDELAAPHSGRQNS